MSLPRVYADFNALEYVRDEGSDAVMALAGYGTPGSLARQGLRLEEGMSLLLYEPNDIECEAKAHFDPSRMDPAGRAGEWVARLDPRKIRDSAVAKDVSKAHPCIACGREFFEKSSTTCRNCMEVCTGCGASIMAPMASSNSAA
jgi:hypothetical protein